MYQHLKELAAERSSEKRLELLRKISAMYFESVGSQTDAEKYLFGEIMDRIVDTVARPEKIEAATSLATLPDFPHDVVVKLASDHDIDIARPVIAHSPVLTDADLVGLAASATQDHLRAIAVRPQLSEAVTDALIDRGDQNVVHTVSANHGARFSERGMDELLVKAREDVDLRELLVERPDLSQATVKKLLPLVSAGLAVRLAERGYEAGDGLSPEAVAAMSGRLAEWLRDRKTSIRDTASLIELVRTEQLSLDEAVCLLARSARLLDLSAVLSAFANTDRTQMFSLLARGPFDAVMVMFKSLGLAFSTLERVLIMRAKKRGESTRLRADLRAEYETINASAAQRALRFSLVRRAAAS